MRSGELDIHGLDPHALRKFQEELDYFGIPVPEVSVTRNPTSTMAVGVLYDKTRCSTNVKIAGNSLTSSDNSWAVAMGRPQKPGQLLYWEVIVDKYKGGAHIRIGIATMKWFSAKSYKVPNAEETLFISPGNVLSGYNADSCNVFGDYWYFGTKIAILFDQNNGTIKFFNGRKQLAQIEEIPDAKSWFPLFAVQGTSDQITLEPDVSPPSI